MRLPHEALQLTGPRVAVASVVVSEGGGTNVH